MGFYVVDFADLALGENKDADLAYVVDFSDLALAVSEGQLGIFLRTFPIWDWSSVTMPIWHIFSDFADLALGENKGTDLAFYLSDFAAFTLVVSGGRFGFFFGLFRFGIRRE